MRVRVVERVQVYWNYAIQTLDPPLEVDGELARHLADNAPANSVEILDEDRKEARAAAARAAEKAKLVPPSPEDPKKTGAPGGGSVPANPETPQTPADPDTPPEDPDGPPVDGTAQDLFDWIDGDRDKAARALEAEQAKDKPRSTVVKRLSAMTDSGDE